MTKSGRSRVFQLITRLLKGGAEDHMIETVLGLNDYDFTVGYGASYDQVQVNRLKKNGVETKRFPLIRHYNPVTSLPAVGFLTKYLKREDFDIIHTNSTEAGIIGRIAATAAEVPNIVHTVHGVPFTDDRCSVLNQFVLGCERFAARYTDKIVTNADVIANEYLERGIGSPNQYTTIYSGIHLDRFQNVSPATDLPGSRPRVVMIGRLAEGKGFELLLEAAESIREKEATICIVGEGPLYDSLKEQIINRGLSDTVYLTGYRNDVPRVLAASDVLAHPSYREGTPRVITEAMASGLPVIATNIAGIPEQVRDGESGYLMPPGNVNVLTSHLNELLSNIELRERMGSRGRELSEDFSVTRMRAETDRLYKKLQSNQKMEN